MPWTGPIPYFPGNELKDPDTNQIKLDRRFAAVLSCLRLKWGEALLTNSVCRSQAHNDEIGGHPSSLHLMNNPEHDTDGTAAADVQWRNWGRDKKLRFARLAWSLGLSVGLHDGFCHVDWRIGAGLPQAVFTYGEWAAPFDSSEVKRDG